MTLPDNEYAQQVRYYRQGYKDRAKAGTKGTNPANHCLVCPIVIPAAFTVCGPEHGAILQSWFDAWRANGVILRPLIAHPSDAR